MVLTLSHTIIFLMAIEHAGISVFEMFFWNSPAARKFFSTDSNFATRTKPMAINQGIYNACFAAGLLFAFYTGTTAVEVLFCTFVAVVGLVGAFTVQPKIFLLQTAPALLALLLIWLA